MARDGLSEQQARDRVGAQMPLEAKRRLATTVVENQGSVDELRTEARALASRLRRQSPWWKTLLFSPYCLLGVLALARRIL